MYPTLFELNIPFIGTINIYSYGFMLLVGISLCIYLFVQRGVSLGYSKDFLLDFSFYVIVIAFIGARILYVIYYSEQFNWSIFKIWEDKGFNIAFAVFWVIVFYMMFTGTAFKNIRSLVLYTIIIFTISGRTGYILENYEYYNFDILAIWKGGIIFYGGLFGGLIGGGIILLIKKINILKMADIVLPLIFLGLFFGRIGCFLRGCCWGKICSPHFPGAVFYPNGSFAYYDHLEKGLISDMATTSLSVYPAQLFESLICLILFLFFWLRFNVKKFPGYHALEVLIFYAAERFVVEFFRGDMTKVAGLSFAQFISIPFIVFLIVLRFLVLPRYYGKNRINI
ncbi:MAG: prolipoprotein diacylglyceryl transferase [Planctomycetota bacterium]